MPSVLRGILRAPGFALTAILTLGLGIGLATAVFTVADALLLRRLPVVEQDRIVVLWGRARDGSFDHFPLTLTDAREFGLGTNSLERVAFASYEGAWPKPIREGEQVSRMRQALVSGEYFDVLGVEPLLGRTLRAGDDVRGAAPVTVLSHSAWQERFGGDPAVLGRSIHLYQEDIAHTIVGVMPAGLDYPRRTDFWLPVTPARTGPDGDAPNAHVDVIGRLMPGASVEHAREELTAFFNRPEANVGGRLLGVAHSLPRLILGDTRPALFAFAVASGLLLLITCINVANLLLVHGIARVREMAVRSALGASRGRVVVQLLVENAIIAAAGGVVGIAIAAAAVRAFVALAPPELPRIAEIGLSAAALAGGIGITAAAMLIFGVAPAIVTSRVEVQRVLRADGRQSASRRARLSIEAMVAGQVALAVLVLSGAGVVTRSLLELQRVELSLEGSGLLIGELALRQDRYSDAEDVRAMVEELVPRLGALPGVRAVSPVVTIPFSGTGGWDSRPAAEGQSGAERAANPMLNMDVVGSDYFTALGIPVLRGRGFTEADREGAPRVIVLSESAASHYWPGEDPIGRRLAMGPTLGQALTVVGIVPETRYRDLRDARPSIYFPLRQSTFPFAPTTLAIRTSGPPAALAPTLRRAIEEAVPGVVLATASPFGTFLDRPLAQPRLNALLLAVFAAAAMMLAAVGLFGVMATMVRQRTRELGIRMALGATAHDLRSMVMRRGVAIASAGMLLGIAGATFANRLLSAMLYEVSPVDAVSLATVAGLLLLVAAFATAIPARASTRVDPVRALRADG